MSSRHPRSYRLQTTVARLCKGYLQNEGVDRIFCIPGGAVASFMEELFRQEIDLTHAGQPARPPIELVLASHESGAVYMADGYHRATGRLGVALVTSGPGSTNALTACVNAHNNGSAVLLITGEAPVSSFGKGFLQEGADLRLDLDAIFDASVGHSSMVTAASHFNTLFREALRCALTKPKAAVQVILPDDVASQTTPLAHVDVAPVADRYSAPSANEADVIAIYEAMMTARRPVIFLGSGAREALQVPATRQQLFAFVERHGVPVMTTPGGKNIFPEEHELSLGVFGFASCLWTRPYLRPESGPGHDCMLVIGSTLHALSTQRWHPMLQPDGPLIQVDVDPRVIGRSMGVSRGIVADAGSFLDLLTKRTLEELIERRSDERARDADALAKLQDAINERKRFVKRIKDDLPGGHANRGDYETSAGGAIHPAAAMRVLGDALRATATGRAPSMVFVDSGNCVGWVTHYLRAPPDCEIHMGLVMAPMGFAVAAVIGAKAGAPERQCMAVVGDGAFMMHGTEVLSAARKRIGAVWIVLVDGDLGMVTQGMAQYLTKKHDGDARYNWEALYEQWSGRFEIGFRRDDDAPKPDIAAFAESLGAQAHRCEDLQQFEACIGSALRAADDGIPQVLALRVRPREVPPYYHEAFQEREKG